MPLCPARSSAGRLKMSKLAPPAVNVVLVLKEFWEAIR
jgi:hypothetical protein